MVSLYRKLAALLESHHIPDAEFDARCIIEQATETRLEQLSGIPAGTEQKIRAMAERRISGEPLQYILGEWEFFGMRLFVGKGVLIPRPDTEVLAETVLDWCRDKQTPRILDLCTGSGCIALALQKFLPHAEVHALDLSDAALSYAKQNIAYHQLPVALHRADVLHAEAAQTLTNFDVIVSNPPYLTAEEMTHLQPEIRYEPESALAAGTDGLQFYRSITRIWKDSLRPGALLAYEIGEQQGKAVTDILRAHHFDDIRIIRDYARHDRVVTGIRK